MTESIQPAAELETEGEVTAGTSAWNWLTAAAGPAAGAARPLAWHPSELEACLAARAQHLPEPLRAEELDELRAAHVGWGADAATLASIDRLGSRACRVVVAGQQPGLLAGPLLVIYKTLAAIELARRIEREHPEVQAVPVFWVASEDHDFAEIRRAYWPAAAGGLEALLLPAEDWKPGQMVGGLPVWEIYELMRSRMEQSATRGEHTEALLAALAAAHARTGESAEDAGPTLEHAFATLLLRMLPGSGLVVVSPCMPWLRRRAAPVVARELAQPGATSAAVRARAEELQRLGYPAALHRHPGAVNTFLVDDLQRRLALRVEDDGRIGARVAGLDTAAAGAAPGDAGLQHYLPAELSTLLERDPLRFSTNVVTRPAVQDTALPTVAQIVGPGEAAYLAQVEGAFPQLGAFCALRWPRPRVLLLEPRVLRALEKFGLTVDDAAGLDADELARLALRQNDGEAVLMPLRELRARNAAELEAVRAGLTKGRGGAIDPAIDGAFAKLLQAMEKGFASIEERVLYQRQRDEGHLQQAAAMVANYLCPGGLPQERALNAVVPFAVSYGLDWPMRLAAQLDFSASAASTEQRIKLERHAAGA